MGSGFRTFTAGEVLTASNVQNYLQDQVVMTFAGSAARSSAIGTANFEEGMVSYLTDTDKVEAYNGTNWVQVGSSNQGLTLINTTSFSGVSSQSINNCFNSSYRNYRIFLDFAASTTLDINFRLRVGGVDNSTANSYNRQNMDANGSTLSSFRSAGTQHLMGGGDSTAVNMITMDITRPFLADTTGFNIFNQRSQANAWMMLASGFHNQSVSYDGITILVSTGNITGQISVYGYNA